VAHQLRTPLTVVRGGLAILDEPAARLSTDERREVMADIREETERLVRVVDDLVVLLAPDTVPLRTEPVLLQRLVPAMLGAEPAEGVRSVEARLDDGLPAASGDPDQVAHILRNLVAAAARVDPRGEVRVVARAQGPWVEIEVRPIDGSATDARLSPDDGSALALRSARLVATAIGGKVALRRSRGYRLTLRLPVSPDDG
jgi:signal transduction histidine kinase